MLSNFFSAYKKRKASSSVSYQQAITSESVPLREPNSIDYTIENMNKAKKYGLEAIVREDSQQKSATKPPEKKKMKIVDRQKLGKVKTQTPSSYFLRLAKHN